MSTETDQLETWLTNNGVPQKRAVAPEAEAAKAEAIAEEEQTIRAMRLGLEKLYNDKGGNLEDIFDTLGEDPGKALKYPPADATTFARKYLEGSYTYIEVRKQPSRAKIAKAVEHDPMVRALAALYEKHDGDLEAIFEALGENPGKALK